MKRLLAVIWVLLVMFLAATSAFAGGTTTCSLSASSAEIITGQSVSWTTSSMPSRLPYVWHIDGPLGHKDVPGEATTGWSGKYGYDTPGVYTAHFTIAASIDNTECTSNVVGLTVNPIFVAGTNIFPNGGTSVQGEYFDIRIYSNAAPWVKVYWILVAIDNEPIQIYNNPDLPFTRGFGSGGFRSIGQHTIKVWMNTSAGDRTDEADYQVISDDDATPHQITPPNCVPLPTVASVNTCAPPPPQPPKG